MKKKGKGSFLVFNGGEKNLEQLNTEVKDLTNLIEKLEKFNTKFISRESYAKKNKNDKKSCKLKNCNKNQICFLIYDTHILKNDFNNDFNFNPTVELYNERNSGPNYAKFTIKNLLDLKLKFKLFNDKVSIKERISPEVYYVLSCINNPIAKSFFNKDDGKFDNNLSYNNLITVYGNDNDTGDNKQYYINLVNETSSTDIDSNDVNINFTDSNKVVLDQTKSRIYIYAKYLQDLLKNTQELSKRLDNFLYLNPDKRGTEKDLIENFDSILESLKKEKNEKHTQIMKLKTPKYTLPIINEKPLRANV